MATIKRFYDLEAWKKARTLNLEIYKMTRTENFKKDFILVLKLKGETEIRQLT